MSDVIYTSTNPGQFSEKMEKHVPEIELDDTTVKVRVGAVTHPMDADHFIEWIALYDADGEELDRVDLEPGQAPEALFTDIENTEQVKARAHCNLHGTWESD